ncbi:hypothetical protein N9355_05990 [Crocinitomicaceae bacterium]|nr:hypothetical protein [Crocinitomicaceae bacterium]
MKKLLIVVGIILMGNTAKAQDYYHGLGGQINYGLFVSQGSTIGAYVPGFVYKATLGFDGGRGPSFGLSAYPFAGLSFNTAAGSSLGAELPIVGEVHFREFDDRDFFIGAGFSASFTAGDGDFGGGGGSILGPQLSLGGQFEAAGRLLGLRFAYTYGVNRNKTTDLLGVESLTKKSLFSLGAYYLFGQ